jgi:hypothetical protein
LGIGTGSKQQQHHSKQQQNQWWGLAEIFADAPALVVSTNP